MHTNTGTRTPKISLAQMGPGEDVCLLIPRHAHRDYSNIQRGRTMYVHIVPLTLNWEKKVANQSNRKE